MSVLPQHFFIEHDACFSVPQSLVTIALERGGIPPQVRTPHGGPDRSFSSGISARSQLISSGFINFLGAVFGALFAAGLASKKNDRLGLRREGAGYDDRV